MRFMITTIVCTNANMDTSAMAHTTGVEVGAEEEVGDGVHVGLEGMVEEGLLEGS
jgi:hypothetical protein